MLIKVIQFLLFALLLSASYVSFAQIGVEIHYLSKDKVAITADLYLTGDEDAPFIILYHQAGFSRGEYIEIAPKLNKIGFNCIAVDQRSGLEVNGVINNTYLDAVAKNKKTKYPDAYPDLEATLTHVIDNYAPNKLLVWGSSYSSSLVFILTSKHPNDIDGILSFSPGEYFKYEDKEIKDWAKNVTCPVFVTSSKNEGKECAVIFNETSNAKNIHFIPTDDGFHGSKALWEEKPGNEEYWKAVEGFLDPFMD